jgi:glycine/D-amino acid oxidase-like deaminating enzyme
MLAFLVVGGGIAGVAAAARLSALGAVLVVEAEAALAHHASGRSAAVYEEGYGLPEVQALTRASRPELEARGVLSPRGLLLSALPGEEAAFEADRTAIGMAEIELAEARARLPILGPAPVRTAWTDDLLDLDTDRLLQGFRREALARGARIATRASLTALRRTPAGWEAEAGGETVAAARIVNAAGPWADPVAALAGLPPLGLRPLRRSMARVPAPSDPRLWPMLVGAGESFYMKPDAGALIVSPAEEDPQEPQDAWADDLVLAEGLARYETHVTAPVQRLLASWAGLRTFAPDRRLVLGPDPLDPAFLWCAGQGGYGFQTACAASLHLAALAADEAPPLGAALAAALSPGRLR